MWFLLLCINKYFQFDPTHFPIDEINSHKPLNIYSNIDEGAIDKRLICAKFISIETNNHPKQQRSVQSKKARSTISLFLLLIFFHSAKENWRKQEICVHSYTFGCCMYIYNKRKVSPTSATEKRIEKKNILWKDYMLTTTINDR